MEWSASQIDDAQKTTEATEVGIRVVLLQCPLLWFLWQPDRMPVHEALQFHEACLIDA